jgi:thioredoxin-related protein
MNIRTYIWIVFTMLYLPCLAQSGAEKETKSETIKWMSFEEAFKKNKEKPKKIFVDVYTDWCGWCKKMDATTFTNPVIVAYMNKNFYCAKLDAERRDTVILDGVKFNPGPSTKRSTHQLAVELLRGKMSYPSYAILDEKGKWINVIPGYYPAADFEPMIHFYGDGIYKKQPWEEFKAGFKGEVK